MSHPNAFQNTVLSDIDEDLTFYYVVDEYGYCPKTTEVTLEAARLKANTGNLYICIPEIMSPNAISSVIRSGKQVTVSAVCDIPGSVVCCAVYDEAGRMLEFMSQVLKEKEPNTFVFSSDSFPTTTAFLLNSHWVPLCEKKDAV